MGFLDKVKTQAEQAVKQGQDKLEEAQAKKKADGLLRDLGAWYYAIETGRDNGQGAGELSRITDELKAHEAEHGQLGASQDDEVEAAAPAPPAPPAASPPPPAPAPPAMPDPSIPPPPPPGAATPDSPPPPPPA